MAIGEGISTIYREIKKFRSRRHGKEFGEKFLERYFSRFSGTDRLRLYNSLPIAIDVEVQERGLYRDAFVEGVNKKLSPLDIEVRNGVEEGVEYARN